MTKKGEARRPLPLLGIHGFPQRSDSQQPDSVLIGFHNAFAAHYALTAALTPGLQFESEFGCGFVRNRIVAPEILKILVGGEAADFRLVDIQFTA